MFQGRTRIALVGALAAVVAAGWGGCTSPQAVDDPYGTLASPNVSGRKHLGAMLELDANPTNPDYLKQLHAILYRPGYTQGVREAAFDRLLEHDRERLDRTIRQHLPLIKARGWHRRLCELIAENEMTELTPALVSSWANVVGFVDDADRSEYEALCRLYDPDQVIDVVFDVMVGASKPYQTALRSRCWQLLNRLGERQRLMQLLLDQQQVAPEDLMLIDLRAAALELRIVPRTREEVLWVRKLRQPEHAGFWSQAADVVRELPESRWRDLELRDLPIMVAASIHEPWLLTADNEEIYERIAAYLSTATLHVDPDRFTGFPGSYPQRLPEQRKVLTWSDLSAMLLAVRAMQVPQVADHLFDYADRDHADKSCEYGGVIRLDDKGRFEILEFPPRFRRRDNEFIASQQMMDAGYTAVFHFHFHVQKRRNQKYAVPGMGDLNYADNTRANCLVLTSINLDILNVDFYRHGRMIVDLGEVKRP
jgi:hypothetical protein